MISFDELKEFYRGKRVLVTGHTGFKGTWMCVLLKMLGADVYGYALEPEKVSTPSLYELVEIDKDIHSEIGDIRDIKKLSETFTRVKPEIVIHMAAQPIVRESYKNPVGTYETNVMGTVNVLECCRHTSSVKSVVNVTTDKVYRNEERAEGYREEEYLDGYDPYSNSKSCSELVTSSYKNSFFSVPNTDESMAEAPDVDENGMRQCAISTCRAGNVIGGGDFAKDRIIPDAIRAFERGNILEVRNPFSIRPYQHVLEPVVAYLYLAMKQYKEPILQSSYNVGPNKEDCITTGELVSCLCDSWGDGAKWISKSDGGPHEANFLKLDCSKIKDIMGWNPAWHVNTTIDKIVEFEKARIYGRNASGLREIMEGQIWEYVKES